MQAEYVESLPWVEKYRPDSLDQMKGHAQIIQTMQNFIKKKALPHLLFYGPAGTGKTSLIHACAKQLYSRFYRMMILELNASDERGIDVVRKEIKGFASTRAINGQFKLVILDEADSMTNDAQAALRRMIERFTSNVRFCLIGNYINKIIPALQSRCTIFRFSPLNREQMTLKLQQISQKEHLRPNTKALETIIDFSNGDMRKSINILQSVSMMKSKQQPIEPDDIYLAIGHPKPEQIKTIVEWIQTLSYGEAYHRIHQLQKDEGYSLSALVTNLHTYLLSPDQLNNSEERMINIIYQLSQLEYHLSLKTNPDIQLGWLVAGIVPLPLRPPTLNK